MLTHVTSMGHDLTRRDHNREKPIPQSPPDVYANRLAEIESRPTWRRGASERMPGIGLLTRLADVFSVPLEEFLKRSRKPA